MKRTLIVLGILVGACGGDGSTGDKGDSPTAVAQRDGETARGAQVPASGGASATGETGAGGAAMSDGGLEATGDAAVASGRTVGDVEVSPTPATACTCGVNWEVVVDANGTPHCRSTSAACPLGEACPVSVTNCRTRETPLATDCRCEEGWEVERDDDGLPRCRLNGDGCQPGAATPGAPCVRPAAPCL